MPDRDRERMRENYLLWEKFAKEKLQTFYRFCHFFQITFYPEQYKPQQKTLSNVKFCPTNTFSEDTLIYAENLQELHPIR